MNTQQAVQPTRTLTSALDRLKSIDLRLAAANEQSRRFLDALVGQKPEAGQTNTVGASVQATCFVSELHRLIDGIEGEALKASRLAIELVEAGGCSEVNMPSLDEGPESVLAGLYAQGAAAQRFR